MPRTRRRALAALAGSAGLLGALFPVPAGAAAVDDPVFAQGLQWGLDQIHAPDAWDAGTGRGITIAVVDSGVDLAHEDLRAKVVAQASCIDSGGDAARCHGSAQDDNGHGTHVAGIALATTDNGRGIAGVAPDATLMAVRVLANTCDAEGTCEASGTSADVSAGIRWAADHGADVINLSLGRQRPPVAPWGAPSAMPSSTPGARAPSRWSPPATTPPCPPASATSRRSS